MKIKIPGRVNYLGEHTDYNNGFVLPAPAGKFMEIEVEANDSDEIKAIALDYQEEFIFTDHTLTREKGWKAYVLGMTTLVQQKTGKKLSGISIKIKSDIPVGSGMSSSAALCCGLGLALSEYFKLNLNKEEIALLAQKTEHEFAGVMCGIMDQYAVLFGKPGYLLKLDCRSLDYSYIPFNFPDYTTILLNSGVNHSLAESEYNIRRSQCEEGVEIIKKSFPEVDSLRDVNMSMLNSLKEKIPSVIYIRCKYVVEENARVEKGCEYLLENNLEAFGALMNRTHIGLSKEYEVSCPELDELANAAWNHPGVIGSRMMGGGFGGCTINIVSKQEAGNFLKNLEGKYLFSVYDE